MEIMALKRKFCNEINQNFWFILFRKLLYLVYFVPKAPVEPPSHRTLGLLVPWSPLPFSKKGKNPQTQNRVDQDVRNHKMYKLSESAKSCSLLWTSAVFSLVEFSVKVSEL